MSSPLEIVIPTSQIDFYNSVVSDGGNLKYFDPNNHLSIKIFIYDYWKPYTPTALALDNAIKTGTFSQTYLEDFLTDPSNFFSVDLSDPVGNFSYMTPGISFLQYTGTLKLIGSEVLYIPRLITFDLPSFVQFSGNGYGEGYTERYGPSGESLSYKTAAIDLSGASIDTLKYSFDNFFDVDLSWYQTLDLSFSKLISAGNDVNKYFSAFSDFLVANEEPNRDDYNFRMLNFNINPALSVDGNSITNGISYVIDASIVNGSIELDTFPSNLIMMIDSVDFQPGPVAENLVLSPVFQSTDIISITPSYITETYFNVFLKPGFSNYPLSLINQIYSSNAIDQVTAVEALLTDSSVVITANIEFATEQDLNGDNILDGENFTFGIKDIKYVNGAISITPDKPTNFIIKTGFNDFNSGSAMPDLVYGLGGNDNILTLDDDDSIHGGAGNDTIDGGNGNDTAYFQGPKADYSINSLNGMITVVDSLVTRDGTDTLNNIESLVFSDQTISATSIPVTAPITGTPLSESLYGMPSSDLLYGLGGADSLYGGKGSDYIDGGDGFDTAFQELDAPLYVMTYDGKSQHITLLNNYRGVPEIDTLVSVEKIQFADTSLDTSFFLKTAQLSKQSVTNLVELYIASFNRAPDAMGLNYWGSRLYDGMSLEQIAKSFFVQKEAVAAYPAGQATATFVTTVYNNVLSRGPDQSGLDYWVKQIDNGVFSKDVFLLAIINGAKATTGSPTDRQTLANKTTVGMDFAFSEGLSNTTWGKDVMSGVTSVMSTVDAAMSKTDAYGIAASSGGIADLTIKMVGIWDGIG